MIFCCLPLGYHRSNKRRAAYNLWQFDNLDKLRLRLPIRGVAYKQT